MTMQNEVSIFIAGYKAGIVKSGALPIDIVEKLSYSDVNFGNIAKRLLLAYQSKKTDEEGLEKMYELLKSDDDI